MTALWRHHFTQQSLYYIAYNCLVAVVYLIIVSLISFFHFLLDHRLGVIEEWIFDRGWHIVITAKTLALAIMLISINIHSHLRHPLKEIFRKGLVSPPQREIFITIVFSIFVVIFLARPELDIYPDISVFKITTSFIGSVLFYILDIFFLISLQDLFPLEKKYNHLKIVIFPLFFLFFSKIIFLFGLNLNMTIFCHMFLCLYLSNWESSNWSIPIIYLILFVSPISAFLGMDAIWGGTYSVFRMTRELDGVEMPTLSLVSLLYLIFKKKAR